MTHLAEQVGIAAPNSINFPFYLNTLGFSSKVLVNNNNSLSTTLNLWVFGNRGSVHILPAQVVSPRVPLILDLALELQTAPAEFAFGSIHGEYTGAPQQITGQVSIVDPAGRVSVESPMAMGGASNRLVVPLPGFGNPNIEYLVAITNVSSGAISVSRENSDVPAAFLQDHQTKILQLEHPTRLPSLLSFRHNGAPGDISIIGVAFDRISGFSTTLRFSDPAEAVSNSLLGAGFFTAPAANSLELPAGTTFESVLTIANTSESATDVTVALDYTVNGYASSIDLGSISLAPSGVRDVNLTYELDRVGVYHPQDAGAEIRYTGRVDSVVAKLISFDSSGDFAFDIPMKDPESGRYRSSGSHPWRIGANVNTLLFLKNRLGRVVHPMVVFRFMGGQYTPPLQTRGPYQTISIDIKELVMNSKADLDGQTIAMQTSGKVLWFQDQSDSLSGRAEIFDSSGVSGSASCFYPCNCARPYFSPNSSNTYLYPATNTLAYLDSESVPTFQRRYDCNNTNLGLSDVSSQTSYSSANNGILHFTGQMMQGVCIGSTTLAGQTARNTDQPPQCPVSGTANPSQSGTVYSPIPTKVLPMSTVSSTGNSCMVGQAGWVRTVRNQIQDQYGRPYNHSVTVADTITIGSPNNLNITGTRTGSAVTSATGSWTDYCDICSSSCPVSTGETDATQSWTYNGLPLPHSNLVIYKCQSVTVDGY